MATLCPHCGAGLSGLSDAYCSECRGPLGDQHDAGTGRDVGIECPRAEPKQYGSNPFEAFSVPTRLVIVGSIVASVCGTAIFICWIYEDLPPGSYPIWFFALPVLMAVGLFCVACLWALRLCGIPIYRRDSDLDATDVFVIVNIEQRGDDTWAELPVRADSVAESRVILIETPLGRLIQLKLNPAMADGTCLRLTGQAFTGRGDLFLRVCISGCR